MSFVAKSLLSTIFFITLCFLFVIFFLLKTPIDTTTNLKELIQIPGVSLSASYLDDRILEYKDETHSIYFNLTKDNYSSYVYAK